MNNRHIWTIRRRYTKYEEVKHTSANIGENIQRLSLCLWQRVSCLPILFFVELALDHIFFVEFEIIHTYRVSLSFHLTAYADAHFFTSFWTTHAPATFSTPCGLAIVAK